MLVAGGGSRRMGGDKALMPLGGRPMIAHAAGALTEVFERVVVAAKDTEKFSFLGLPLVEDELDISSPLAGVHAGLLALDAPWALAVGCDTPFLQPEFLRFMASEYRGEEALAPFVEGHLQPLHAIYAKCAAPRIEAFAASGRRAAHEFLESLSLRILRDDGVAAPIGLRFGRAFAAFAPSFRNINTPEEFAEAERILAAG